MSPAACTRPFSARMAWPSHWNRLPPDAPVPVRLSVNVDGRVADAIEVAAYYVVCESLTNIGKHAEASSARVDVDQSAARSWSRSSTTDGAAQTPTTAPACADSRIVSKRSAVVCGSGPRATAPGFGQNCHARSDRRGQCPACARAWLGYLPTPSSTSSPDARDADELRQALRDEVPDVVIVDIRLPPTHTDEGLQAALDIRQ